eukprot:7214738-Pyramimonas_sp.AAC.1
MAPLAVGDEFFMVAEKHYSLAALIVCRVVDVSEGIIGKFVAPLRFVSSIDVFALLHDAVWEFDRVAKAGGPVVSMKVVIYSVMYHCDDRFRLHMRLHDLLDLFQLRPKVAQGKKRKRAAGGGPDELEDGLGPLEDGGEGGADEGDEDRPGDASAAGLHEAAEAAEGMEMSPDFVRALAAALTGSALADIDDDSFEKGRDADRQAIGEKS